MLGINKYQDLFLVSAENQPFPRDERNLPQRFSGQEHEPHAEAVSQRLQHLPQNVVPSRRVSSSLSHLSSPHSFCLNDPSCDRVTATVTSRLTPGPRRTSLTSVSLTQDARAKASSSPNRTKLFHMNTWSARFTSPGWASVEPHSPYENPPDCKHISSAAFHHWRIQVRFAYLRAGDIMWPTQGIHVQGGPGPLLHHQVQRASTQQRGQNEKFPYLSYAAVDCIHSFSNVAELSSCVFSARMTSACISQTTPSTRTARTLSMTRTPAANGAQAQPVLSGNHFRRLSRLSCALVPRKLSTLNKLLESLGCNTEKMWTDIEDAIVKTLISAHPILKHNYHTCFPNHTTCSACFEILGFDVLLDHRLRPWVLEVEERRTLIWHEAELVLFGISNLLWVSQKPDIRGGALNVPSICVSRWITLRVLPLTLRWTARWRMRYSTTPLC